MFTHKIQPKARIGLVWLTLIASSPAWGQSEINTTFFGNLAIKGYDAVAFFSEGRAVKGSANFEYDWNGATWQFSSAENQALFAAQPDNYAPQYGGYCAWAVSQGYTAGIEPEQFEIVNDKLYLTYDAQVKQKWLRNRDAFIAAADKHWPAIVNE